MPINTPTISIVDSADGTGGVATIAGATALTTNDVYVSDDGGDSWALEGTRSGDGTVTLTLADGRHWAYVLSSLAGEYAVSLVRGFRTTDGTQSVYYQCIAAVQTIIQSLNLSGVDPSDVKAYKLPWNRSITGPGIIVCPERDKPAGGTNTRDNIVYGVAVAVIRRANQDLSAGMATGLNIREIVHRAFRQNTLAGVSEIYHVEVVPGVVFDHASFLSQYDVQGLTINCHSREVRGVA